MPGYTNKSLTGYYETEYASDWPGLVTNLPTSRIPPGAASSCQAMAVRGRLTAQPALYPLTGSGGLPVVLPTFVNAETIGLVSGLNVPGTQSNFTVIVTNLSVYADYTTGLATTKTFAKLFTFATPYPIYTRFSAQTIGSTLYITSGTALGVYALRPTFSVASVVVSPIGANTSYSAPPTVTFSDGGGTGAAGTAVLTATRLTGVTVTNGGSGYVSPPIVTFSGNGSSVSLPPPTGVGVLNSTPSAYIVQEISAFTGVAYVTVTAGGSGYLNPTVSFVGGGGTAAAGTVFMTSGVIVAIAVNVIGANYTSAPTVVINDPAGTGATATATLWQGKPYIGGDFTATVNERLILGNIIGGDGNNTTPLKGFVLTAGGSGYATAPTVDLVGGGGINAVAIATEFGGIVTGVALSTAGGSAGSGYYSTPQVNLLSNTGSGATAIAQLAGIPMSNSTSTRFPDRVAWSAPNAFWSFDPNYLPAPGGFNTLSEAQGLVSGLAVFESVCFVGHNGGITEMTPNTSSAITPFAFYPLWGGEQGQIVRYGSLAQFGSLAAFLAQDTAYTLTPGGVTEIGQNISNLLQGATLWNYGQKPLQGLNASIILVEGQKHYLIGLSAADPALTGAATTFIYDFNLNENSWHTWSYPGLTLTAPVYQSFDLAIAGASTTLYPDQWIIFPSATTSGGGVVNCAFYEIAPLVRSIQLKTVQLITPITIEIFAYQFRTEAPSTARMQSERRIIVEYENIPGLATSPTPNLALTYTGQQDPTFQTGTISQQQGPTNQGLIYLSTPVIPGQVFTLQADFGTFTGVCVTLSLAGTPVIEPPLFALVRLTQVAEIAKGQIA